jgi:hypothetical protein
MADNDTKDLTTQQVPNPTGKGGFGEHPENRSPGGWKPENTFSYQMNRFKAMTLTELEDWNKNTSKDKRTVAEDLAFRRIFNSQNKLDEFKEVANRTEGMPKQEVKTDGEMTVTIKREN